MNDRAKDVVDELAPVSDERLEQPAISIRVSVECACCFVERSTNEQRRAIVVRMRECCGWVNEVELQRPEERRRGCEGMNRGADVGRRARS